MEGFTCTVFMVSLIAYVCLFFKEADIDIGVIEFLMRWSMSVFSAAVTTFPIVMLALAVFK